MHEWFIGNKKTDLRDGEVAVAVEVPLPPSKQGACYAKLKRYAGEDLAQASVAVLALPKSEYRVAFGAVAPRPVRSGKIERLLKGKKLSPQLLTKLNFS